MKFQKAFQSTTVFAAAALLTVAITQPLHAQVSLPDCGSNANTILAPLARPAVILAVLPCASIVGTWQVHVSPDGVPDFTAYNVFYADGNSTEFDNSNPPGTQTIAVGPWKRIGDRQYSMVEINQLFDGQGNFAGIFKVNATITLDSTGNHYTSKFQFQVFDPTGASVFTGTGTATAVRVQPD